MGTSLPPGNIHRVVLPILLVVIIVSSVDLRRLYHSFLEE